MKHLKRYNESYDDKEPLDPMSDLDDFCRKFDFKSPGVNQWIDFEEDSRYLISENPTMSDNWEIYGIFKYPHIVQASFIGYLRGVNEFHAQLRFALDKNNKSYASSWYGAKLLTSDDIDGKIDELEHELNLLRNPI